MSWAKALLVGGSIAAAVVAALGAMVVLADRSGREYRERKIAEDCHWAGYRTATVRCHGTGTAFDAAGGVRDRCVMVTTGYRMDGMTIEAGKWSLPRAACSVEWAR